MQTNLATTDESTTVLAQKLIFVNIGAVRSSACELRACSQTEAWRIAERPDFAAGLPALIHKLYLLPMELCAVGMDDSSPIGGRTP